MMTTIREQLLSELPNMPQDRKDQVRWKDSVTKKYKCDRSYIDKIIREARWRNDPTV
jgi:hypothetical protein